MAQMISTFREFVAPLSAEEFFSDYYASRPLHIPGSPDKFAGVASWESFNEILAMTTLWTNVSLELHMEGRSLDPHEYCVPHKDREGRQVLRPNFRRVADLAGRGATIVANFVDTMTPGIRRTCRLLEAVTGGATACTAFCSRQGKQGYRSHFDTLHVFALQIEGEKRWHVYEGRMADGAEFPGYNSGSYSQEQHQKAKGEVLMEVVVKPGDVLYLPPGQYHDAVALSDSCLHIGFGVRHYTGMDFINLMNGEILKDPSFRAPLPHYDDNDALKAHLRRLAERLQALITDPSRTAWLRDHQRAEAFGRFPAVRTPHSKMTEYYRVRFLGRRVEQRGNAWHLTGGGTEHPLDAAEAAFAEWLIERELVTTEDLEEAFSDREPAQTAALMTKMETLGLVERI